MTNHDPALLVGRILASVIFILGGYGKLMAAAATKAYFAKTGLPMPDIAYWLAVGIELGGGILLLLGLLTRPTALVLAVFCVATAVIAHMDFTNQAQTINFNKNLAMAGGFLAFTAAGAGRFSLDALLFRRR